MMDGLQLVLHKGYQVSFSAREDGRLFYVYAIRDGATIVESGETPDAAWEKLCRQYSLRDIGDGEPGGTYQS